MMRNHLLPSRGMVYALCSVLALTVLSLLNLTVGAVDIPPGEVWNILTGRGAGRESWQFIIMETRLPQTLTAILVGAALACCGLLLQTAFRNPLAGPGIFGISNGASLGVAIMMLAMGGQASTKVFSVSGYTAILSAAFVGAFAVSAIILFFSTRVRNFVMLIIIGIMVGYLTSSAVTILNFSATEEGVRSYMVWGMGDFGGVTMEMIPIFASLIVVGLMGALLLVKPLNALLIGEDYAENLGVNVRRLRTLLISVTVILSSVSTAFCGPIAFIGLAVPHMARLLIGTENHRLLLPITLLLGSMTGLFCNLLCHTSPTSGIIPLNAVTPLVGAPVIIYVIVSRNRESY